MTCHELKTWPEYFEEIKTGDKTFEIRKNDRNFKIGDEILLDEYEPKLDRYTGRQLLGKITYIIRDFPIALKDNYIVFSFIQIPF